MSSVPSKNFLTEFQKRLFASRFFLTSVILHALLVIFGGTAVIYHRYTEPPDFTAGEGSGFFPDAPANLPPPQEIPQQAPPTMTVSTPMPSSSIDTITTISTTPNPTFVMPSIVAPTTTPTIRTDALPSVPNTSSLGTNPNVLTAAQAKEIAGFTGGWAKQGGRGGGIGSSVRDREFEFTAYLAKYGNPRDPNRRGDWNSTNQVEIGPDKKERIVRGSLPNLLYYISKKSRDRIKANPEPVPLDLSDEASIMAKKPPFIFFTGHQDFVLTEQEVATLQKYIRLGGCIWGDSSLPGLRSRFDIAFRREMRRVIPDADKDWEVLPANHPLFTNSKNQYYPEIKSVPPGLNYYQDPIYVLKYAGEIAIIYTPNDYGDMWQIGLTADDKYDFARDEKGRYIATNMTLYHGRDLYFRNLELPAVINAYKFGTNVIMHLLTRWEDRIRAAPKGM